MHNYRFTDGTRPSEIIQKDSDSDVGTLYNSREFVKRFTGFSLKRLAS